MSSPTVVGHVVERDRERLRHPRCVRRRLGLNPAHRDPEGRGLEHRGGRLDVPREREDVRAGRVRARLHQPGDGADRGRVAHPVRGEDRVQENSRIDSASSTTNADLRRSPSESPA